MALYNLPKHLHPDFIGGRKPVGDVQIDWSHPLSNGLIFYHLLDGSPKALYSKFTADFEKGSGVDRKADYYQFSDGDSNSYLDIAEDFIITDYTKFTAIVRTRPTTLGGKMATRSQ